jgi:hypothetical protein
MATTPALPNAPGVRQRLPLLYGPAAQSPSDPLPMPLRFE